MRIGELSAETGVPIRAIRYYEDIGVLAAPARTESGYRDYHDDMPDQLRFVRASQKAGLTLNEIRGIFQEREEGMAPCKHVAQLIDRKLVDVAEQWEALQLTKRELERLAARAEHLDPQQCRPESICHIIGIS
ncbi:MAG: MerR family transcriptional regulator [Acidimicrobiia bacterium]